MGACLTGRRYAGCDGQHHLLICLPPGGVPRRRCAPFPLKGPTCDGGHCHRQRLHLKGCGARGDHGALGPTAASEPSDGNDHGQDLRDRAGAQPGHDRAGRDQGAVRPHRRPGAGRPAAWRGLHPYVEGVRPRQRQHRRSPRRRHGGCPGQHRQQGLPRHRFLQPAGGLPPVLQRREGREAACRPGRGDRLLQQGGGEPARPQQAQGAEAARRQRDARRQGQSLRRSLPGEPAPRLGAARRHPRARAPRIHRGGGQALLSAQGHRRERIDPGLHREPGAVGPSARRLDHHPAGGQEPDRRGRGQRGAQDPRDDHRGASRILAQQGRDPRALSQLHLSRPRRLGHRARGPRLFRQIRKGSHADRGRADRGPDQGAELCQPRPPSGARPGAAGLRVEPFARGRCARCRRRRSREGIAGVAGTGRLRAAARQRRLLRRSGQSGGQIGRRHQCHHGGFLHRAHDHQCEAAADRRGSAAGGAVELRAQGRSAAIPRRGGEPHQGHGAARSRQQAHRSATLLAAGARRRTAAALRRALVAGGGARKAGPEEGHGLARRPRRRSGAADLARERRCRAQAHAL